MSGLSGRNGGADVEVQQVNEAERTARTSVGGLNTNRMLTEREVAALLECAPISIRRARVRGHIAYHRYSRKRIRYTIEDVRAYQMSRRVEASETPQTNANDRHTQPRSNVVRTASNIAADRAAAQAILNRRQRS